MNNGMLTAHRSPLTRPAAAPPAAPPDNAQSLLNEIKHYANAITKLAEAEAGKPAAAVSLPRLRRMADELGEVFDLLRAG